MASTYTTRIKLEKQGDGENANTWGQRLNNNVIDVLDDAVAGYYTVNIEGLSGDVTLSDGDGSADNTARNFGLNVKGAMSSDVTIVVPAREKIYFVNNEATGGTVFIKPTGGTAVTVARSMMVATSGTIMDTLTGFTPESIIADVSIQGNLTVSGNVSASSLKAPTVSATTKIHAPAISVTNVSATTIKANTVSCVTLSATDVRATNVTATNIKGATVSADVVRAGVVSATTRIQTPLVCATNVTATNIHATTKIHTPAISATHVSATNVKISSNLSVAGNVSVGNTVFAPTVSAATIKAGSLLIGGEAKDNFAAGTRLAFNQNSAPTGWTIVTDSAYAGAALRVVNAATSGGQTGGSNEFTSVFNTNIVVSVQGTTNNQTISGTTGSHALTTAQIPSHGHEGFAYYRVHGGQSTWPGGNTYAPDTIYHENSGHTNNNTNAMSQAGVEITRTKQLSNGATMYGASGHQHNISGFSHSHQVSITDSFNLDVKYVNFIVCEKD